MYDVYRCGMDQELWFVKKTHAWSAHEQAELLLQHEHVDFQQCNASHLTIFWLKFLINFVRIHSSLSDWVLKANMLWKEPRGRGVRESKCRQLHWLNRNFNLAKPSWLFYSSGSAVLSSASEKQLSVLFFPVIPNIRKKKDCCFYVPRPLVPLFLE